MNMHALARDPDLASELVAGLRGAGFECSQLGRSDHPAALQQNVQRNVEIVGQLLWDGPMQSPSDGEQRTIRSDHRARACL